mgnify:CR=1 FL=1
MKKFLLIFSFIILSSQLVFAQFPFNRRFQSQEQQKEVGYDNPAEYEIAEINVLGLETLDRNALISLSGLVVGDRIQIPGEEVNNAIKKLWKSGILGDVAIYVNKVEDDKAYLTIELQERPRLTRFTFSGINQTQENELSDEINLVRGRVLSDAVLKNIELTVKKYFIEKGYLKTEVDIEREKDTLMTSGVKINIQVDKNKKIKVNEVEFLGNENFFDPKLKSKLKNTNERLKFTLFKDLAGLVTSITPKKLVNFFTNRKKVEIGDVKNYLSDNVRVNFFNTSKFIEDEFEEDLDQLITFYNSRGYRDAEVLYDSIYFYDDNSINIDIKVDEGQKYYFRDVNFTGNFVYPDSLLHRRLGIKSGSVYDMELLEKKLAFDPTGDDISSLYMDNGYLFYRAIPVETQINNDSIDVEIRIVEGEQATINKVIITGNDRTNDHVIRREIRTLPGDKFNRSLLIRTTRELSQLGYFDPEQINPVPMPNPVDGTVDIEYQLVERPSDQIELSGGWGGYFGFVGTVGIVFNNFSVKNIPKIQNWKPLPVGDGQKLSLRVQANGRAFQNYQLSFSEPWLGGKKPNSLTVSVNRAVQRRFTNFFDTRSDVNGAFKLNGVTLSLGRRLKWPDDYFTLSNSLSFLRYDLNNYQLARGFDNGNFNNFSFNTTLARNSIDQPMYPRTGSQVSLSLSMTPPYSLFNNIDYTNPDLSNQDRYRFVEYHKWMLDVKNYMRIAGDLVLEAKAHMGFIGSYSQEAGIGPFERFVMGGSGLQGVAGQWLLGTEIVSFRGYDDQSVTPDENIFGGVIYNKFGLELRYPVSLNPSATIYLLGFAEAGNNWGNYAEYNPFNLFRVAGVGARIFMPAFGLLGIDYGIGFDDQIGQVIPTAQRFQFTLGQQIR